jgi:hypothetical protein
MLLGAQKRAPRPLDLQVLYSKTTFAGALQYVVECGNFEKAKECYQTLGIDAGNWSRMLDGEASFPQEKEDQLHELCGNQGLLLWRAHRAGKGVYDLQEAKDREIAALKAERDQLKADIETLRRYGVIQGAK